ncbi:MAG TPA: hypothetical protein VED84_02090 [Acidimicrobiales bacterium]|nr:hypothetical protein [Acidimicrobiales bacterium]
MSENPGSFASSIVAAARVDAELLAIDGRWTSENTAELDRAFERAATQALRMPRLAERSLWLRRMARLVVPAPARPRLRRALAFVEQAFRSARARRDR